MAISFRVAGLVTLLTRRPRQLRRKVALIIGINYAGNESWGLTGPQVDVKLVQELLLETFHFSKEDIVVLSDQEGIHNDFLPTHRNIMREVDKFVTEGQSNVDYFFVYSGHSNQREEVVEAGKLPVERDGQEEYIVPSDALADDKIFTPDHGLTISDKKLNELLVKRLGKGCQLVALFDSCHSATLLNLRHTRCNRVGDLMSLIQNSARRVLVEPFCARFSRQVAPASGDALQTLRKSKTQISNMSHDSTMRFGWSQECWGFCPRIGRAGKPQVVCFSACKDSQTTVESSAGGTMIKSIVELLKENPRPSYREVMLAAKCGAGELKKNMRRGLKNSLKKKGCNKPIHRNCLTEEEKTVKNLLHCRFDPQLSSLRPLNTKHSLRICDFESNIQRNDSMPVQGIATRR